MAGMNGTPIQISDGAHRLDGPSVGPSVGSVAAAADGEVFWLPESASWPQAEEDEFEIERRRIDAQLAAARTRVIAARQLAETREVELRLALRAEIVASQESLAAMSRDHECTLAAIRTAARDEVESILAEARRPVARNANVGGDQSGSDDDAQ